MAARRAFDDPTPRAPVGPRRRGGPPRRGPAAAADRGRGAGRGAGADRGAGARRGRPERHDRGGPDPGLAGGREAARRPSRTTRSCSAPTWPTSTWPRGTWTALVLQRLPPDRRAADRDDDQGRDVRGLPDRLRRARRRAAGPRRLPQLRPARGLAGAGPAARRPVRVLRPRRARRSDQSRHQRVRAARLPPGGRPLAAATCAAPRCRGPTSSTRRGALAAALGIARRAGPGRDAATPEPPRRSIRIVRYVPRRRPGRARVTLSVRASS